MFLIQIKSLYKTILTCIIVLFYSTFAFLMSNPTGAPAGRSGGPSEGGATCAAIGCHGPTSNTVVSTLISSNPSLALGYIPGASYAITISVSGSGLKGFQFSAQSSTGNSMGSLIAPPNLQIQQSKWITHRTTSNLSPATWTFTWVAPASGSGIVGFYASGVSGRNNSLFRQTLSIPELIFTPPQVTTTPITSITSSGAISGGNITNSGGQNVTARGVCYSQFPNPTLNNFITTNGTGIGTYTSTLSNLGSMTNHFVRAYATNSIGTAYGNELNFTTTNNTNSVAVNNATGCIGDTAALTIFNPNLFNVANADLRLIFNQDSLMFVGYSGLNPSFNGLTLNVNSGVCNFTWLSSNNINIPAGPMITLLFLVRGNSELSWDTTLIPSEFSDANLNLVPQVFQNGSLIIQNYRVQNRAIICQGQTFQMAGQTFDSSGNYNWILPSSGSNCDTLVNLYLSVIPRNTYITSSTCFNQPYNFNGRLLNQSGIYIDTLTNFLGCDSVVTLSLTVLPNYQHYRNVVRCYGNSYVFGNQTLTMAGVYTHNFHTLAGCDSIVHLNFSLSDSITIIGQGGVNGICPGSTLRLSATSFFTSGTFRWKLNGVAFGSVSSDTLLVSQPGTYQLDVILSPTCTLSSNALAVSVLNCNEISGDLRYDNAGLTPLAGVPVHLKTLLGNIIAADTTDSSGVFHMLGYPNGNYFLDANVNYSWGGTNSTDALLVNRFFTSLVSLTPLRARAGDVNGNQITNSVDALLISRRITNLSMNFPIGAFVTNRPTIIAQGNYLSVSLRVLSSGDVNGSYAIQPLPPVLSLDSVFPISPAYGTAIVSFINPGSGIFERGLCWSYSPSPSIYSNQVSFSGSGGFNYSQSFTGFTNSRIYVRAYAISSLGIFYSNERSFIPLNIGSLHAGGIIFHIDGTGQHGLVCAPFDQGSYQWGCMGTNIGNNSILFGTGMINTQSIVSNCPQRPIAASICSDLVLNGYSDWYLPSTEEVVSMYFSLRLQGLGSFSNIQYWTSSQISSNSASAISFYNCTTYRPDKNQSIMVRAIRSF